MFLWAKEKTRDERRPYGIHGELMRPKIDNTFFLYHVKNTPEKKCSTSIRAASVAAAG